MDQQTLIIGALILLVVGAVLFLVLSSGQKEKAQKRVANMRGTSARGRGAKGAKDDANNKDRRKKLSESLQKIDDQNKQNKKKNRLTLEQMIEQSGMEFSVQKFYLISVVTAFALGGLGFVTGQKLWVTGLMFFVGGIGLPRWFINSARKRRQKKFMNEFSNAIDVIVRGVKSGLPVNECLKIISREAPAPVNEEFFTLTEGLRVGLSLEQGLERLCERMPVQEANFFSIVLLIQQKTGGNLAEALGNLSTVLRSRKAMEGKVKALSSEAKASAMIIGALPFLVAGAVHLSSPEYLQPLFNTKNGNFILLGAGIWMGMGIMVMRKMIAIKV